MIILISTKATICAWSQATRGIEWQIAAWWTHTHSSGQRFSFICWISPFWVDVPHVHLVVQRCLEISQSLDEKFFSKAGTVGWNHFPTRGRPTSTATNIYCLSQRRNNDWLVKGMWIRCFMCSAHRLSSQNIHVLSAKLDCALLAVKTITLPCAVNCSQAQRNVYKKKYIPIFLTRNHCWTFHI